jgi:hypothetical protein
MDDKKPTWHEFKDLEDLEEVICHACTMGCMSITEHFVAVQYIEQVPELLTEGEFYSYYADEEDKDYGCPTWGWRRKEATNVEG